MQDFSAYLQGGVVPEKKNLSQVFLGALGAVGMSVAARESAAHMDHNEFSMVPFAQQDSAQIAQNLLGFPRVSRVCVVLVDGLGALQLQARRGHVPNLRALNLDSQITTVVPATTAAGISALGTGMLPGENAMAGYALRSARTGATFSLIKWDGSGYTGDDWQTQPTLFERLAPADLAQTALVQPRSYIGSGLSLAALRGASAFAAETLAQRFACAADLLAQGKRAVYVYWGDLDRVGHKHGWESEQWIDELEKFDAEFGVFLRKVPHDTLVIVTADHGMVDATEKVDIALSAPLRTDIRQVAGEERAFQIYTSKPAEVAQRWRAELADLAWIFTKAELIASGLLGAVSEFTASVLGDVIAFSKTGVGFVDSRVHSSSAIGLIGVHGSLTPQEMYIPLVTEVC